MRLSQKIGDNIGRVLFYLARSRRRIAAANVALCFPELTPNEQQQLVRRIFRSVGIGTFETANALWGPASVFDKRHTIRGLEHIKNAQARGQGVLLMGCHFTTLDAAARILGGYVSYDMHYRKDPNPLLAYKLIAARKAFVANAIVRTNTRQMVRYLRAGHVVWYAPDQDYGIKHSVFAPFFGIPAASVLGTGRIAQLGNAVVIPFVHYRDQQGHYHLELKPALEHFPTGDETLDAARINDELEAGIRVQPDQYLWLHRRFKTRPPGAAPVYPAKKIASRHKWR